MVQKSKGLLFYINYMWLMQKKYTHGPPLISRLMSKVRGKSMITLYLQKNEHTSELKAKAAINLTRK